MRAVTVVLAIVLVAAPARATPNQDLELARAAFKKGELSKALPLFNGLLYPEVQLAGADDLAEAYVDLGVCRLDAGDTKGAIREFQAALGLDPNRQLDPLFITSKEAIRLFDDTKADLRNRAEREAAAKAQAELLEKQRQYMKSLVVYKQHPFYVNFLPFGLGQFQNGDTGKGIGFLAGEGATFTTSVGIWAYLVNKYGITNHSLKITADEARTIRRLQQVELTTGIAFFALYVWGAIDAYRHYTPQTRVQGDDSLLPKELRQKKPKKPPTTSLLDRIRVAPALTPTGAGVGIDLWFGWEN